MTNRVAVLRVPVVVDIKDNVLITVEMGNSDVLSSTQMVADQEELSDIRQRQIEFAVVFALEHFRTAFLEQLAMEEGYANIPKDPS